MADVDEPQGWEEPAPARSRLGTALVVVGGIAVVAAVAWLVGGSVAEVDPAPSPDGLVVESETPGPGPVEDGVAFLGVDLRVQSGPRPAGGELHRVDLDEGVVGFQVPPLEGGPPWPEVRFTCNATPTRIAFADPGDPGLPSQILFAAAGQHAADRGCELRPPEDAIDGIDVRTWAVGLLRVLHRAGFTATFATPSARVGMTLTAPGLPATDLVVGARSADVGPAAAVAPAVPSGAAREVPLGRGSAVEDAGRLFFQCHPDSVIDVAADTAGLEELLIAIGCDPEAPPVASSAPQVPAEAVLAVVDRLVDAGHGAGGVTVGGVVSFTLDTVEGWSASRCTRTTR
ncbi:hypothetical protein [Euzebya sp.]|uniref:hypothetical protein n=1 Tax=Euzebya sp. TaxID=1971409 RepID=UPI00351298EC